MYSNFILILFFSVSTRKEEKKEKEEVMFPKSYLWEHNSSTSLTSTLNSPKLPVP